MELKNDKLNVKITGPQDLTPEDAEKLSEVVQKLKIFNIVEESITSFGELKYALFLIGFKWYPENKYFVFLTNENRVVKISWAGKWIQFNPKLFSQDTEIRKQSKRVLELIPEDFSIFVGNDSFQNYNLQNALNQSLNQTVEIKE